MKVTVTYQAIVEEGIALGRVQEAKSLLLRLGMQRLGKPLEDVCSKLDMISELHRLESLVDRLMIATDWNDLLHDAFS
jgi:hypothetical protein